MSFAIYGRNYMVIGPQRTEQFLDSKRYQGMTIRGSVMRRGHSLILLNPRAKTSLASLNWVYNCSARPAHWKYAERLRRPLTLFAETPRADGANPHRAIPPIGLFSAFSALLINIPPPSREEKETAAPRKRRDIICWWAS